jgi:serine/threonine protein kinase
MSLAKKTRIISDYKIQERLGSGSFASVYKAIHQPTMVTVAIKMINKTEVDTIQKKTALLEEVEILKSLHFPLIADFFDFFETNDCYNLVIEYLPNGTLHDLISKKKKLEEIEAKRLFLQLISVLDYLQNEKQIVHRDLKSKNIMLDKNYNIRVIDFGFSKRFQTENSLFSTLCGSPESVAPEITLGKPYNMKCDIWSAGTIMYEMIYGNVPFSDENQKVLFDKIQKSEPNYHGISTDFTNLIQDLLKKKPEDRISLSSIKNHPYLLSFGYHQQLNSALKEALTFYKDSFMVDSFYERFSDEYLLVKNRILQKEEISQYIQSLNPIKCEKSEISQPL